MKITIWRVGLFLVQKMSNFLLLGRILPSSTGFPPKDWGKGQDSPSLVGATSKIKKG